MDILFTNVGYEFILRWIHFMAGITWIGILYYFNFIQAPFLASVEAGTKGDVTTKLMPRALWWFRWGAMVTVIAGWLIFINRMSAAGGEFFSRPGGLSITFGGILGTIMWFNVWFIIWPAQKVIIAENVKAQESGGTPDVGSRPRTAFLASRTNTMLSIPMLFLMAASSHLG